MMKPSLESYGLEAAESYASIQKYLIFIPAFNTVIAALLTLLGENRDFWIEFIYSQSIGLSCMVPAIAFVRWSRTVDQLRIGLIVSILLGVLIGVVIAARLVEGLPNAHSVHPLKAMGVGFIFATGGGYFFYSQEGTAYLEREVFVQRRRRRELDHSLAEMQLRMLQAQIEPHFLFNTLAHLSVLIRTDPPRAEMLLSHLTALLRAVLTRSRVGWSDLGAELELVGDYLSIVSIRLGARLKWKIDAPESVARLKFPGLLLQPLVENAIKHGIEPKREGGEINIVVVRNEDNLIVQVIDSGKGLDAPAGEGAGEKAGIGLANVRKRLELLYGTKGRLRVMPNAQSGVTTELEIPL